MHRRMQRLDAAVHHFGKAGQFGDVAHRQAGSLSALRVPPVETSSMPKPGKRAGEVDQAGLVGDGDEGAGGAAQMFGHGCIHSLRFRHPDRRAAASPNP